MIVSGATVLAAELAASRLLAPFFGSSLLVWANLLGMILLYLSAGYWLGGRLADRYPSFAALHHSTAVAAIGLGLVPIVAQPILATVSAGLFNVPLSVLWGSLVAVLCLFAIPITLLGCVSPWAVRLAIDDPEQAGRTAGSLYAVSTLGSIGGAYLAALLLIPQVGTRRTFLTFAIGLLVVSLVGLLWAKGAGPNPLAPFPAREGGGTRAAVAGSPFPRREGGEGVRSGLLLLYLLALAGLLVATALPGGPIHPPRLGRLLYESESAYNYLAVVQTGTRLDLLLDVNEGEVLQSTYDPTKPLTGGEWDYFLVAPYFAPGTSPGDVDRALVLGNAAGTTARELTEAYGPIPIDGVELDPVVVAVGQRYFGMNEPNLAVHVADARVYLRASPTRYRLIALDAFHQLYVPFHLTTREFFAEARAHLEPSGVVAVNTFRPGGDDRLVRAISRTMADVFPSVFVVPVPNSFNTIVVGVDQPATVARARAQLASLTPPLLTAVAEPAAANSYLYQPAPNDLLLTDDLAPVDQLTDEALLNSLVHSR